MTTFANVIAIFLGIVLLTACGPKDEGKVAQYDLYLLIGQSNMAGRGKLADTPTAPHKRVFMLNKDGQWVPARDPLHFDKPKYVGVGPGLSFGKAMAAHDKDRIIGLIPAAIGGSAIASWTPGGYHEQTKSYPYDDAVARTRLALKTGTLKGILWHQGESDAHDGKVQLYQDALVTLALNLRRDLSAPDVPFIVGGLGDYLADKQPETVEITNILKNAPKYISHCGFISTKGLTHNGDNIHFDTPSARKLGERYAKKMIYLQETNGAY